MGPVDDRLCAYLAKVDALGAALAAEADDLRGQPRWKFARTYLKEARKLLQRVEEHLDECRDAVPKDLDI